VSWKPLLQYNFENHVAVDETGNGHTGVVSLPNADCWIDAPVTGVATAILYDNPQSQVTVPDGPGLGGWPGFRVRAVFAPSDFDRRINLVEGDGAFALFVERDASLQGTIYDGTTWYGVASEPGVIQPDTWYAADFEYNPATTLVLRLDGEIVDLMVTHGDPVRPVGPAGIKIGYWPGGDDRYTFLGLMGPVAIDTLDPANDLATVVGKLVCPDGSYQLETLQQIYQQALTPAEQAQADQAGTALLDGVKALLASILGTAGDVPGTIAAMSALHHRVNKLLLADEQAGINMLTDPKLGTLLNEGLELIWSVSGNARDTLLIQALKLAAQSNALSTARIGQLRAQYPGLCATAPSTKGFDPTGALGGALTGLVNGLWPTGSPTTGSGGSSGGGSGGGSTCGCAQPTASAGGGGTGCAGTTGSTTGGSSAAAPCTPCGASTEIHVHVHSDQGGQK